MAFLEWRKFNFFDLKSNIDEGRIVDCFKESKITCTSSGNNQIVLGDSAGQIHLISRTWHPKTFRGYELTVDLIHQPRNSPLLITLGQDEPGINPLIKVWDTSKLDKNSTPHCYRITRALPGNRAVHTSALCVHDSLQLMAVGFQDGSLILYRGDITRDRSSKQKLLRDASSPVTGLAFKTTGSNVFLFVATDSSVLVYNITQKDKEVKFQLDNIGCSRKCSVLAESLQESHFMVGRNDAVYCYTSDGRGPCYAVDGDKKILEWFRTYLIIISKAPNRGSETPAADLITVLDIHNKFIVFSASIPPVKSILTEWGAFYIIDEDNNVSHLDEKDLQSKLSLLFKKNLYDVAIRIAKSHQYDSDGLVNIFKQYGDHLCDKGDFSGAIEQYIKTIGKLESSNVIRKFLDSQHIEKLTLYLEALHKQGHATEDHTTLLLNCYTKLNNCLQENKQSLLKEFILQKDADLSYDVDIAIKVCRQSSPPEALILAKKHKKHDWYIKLQLEDNFKYSEVVEYISRLDFEDAEFYMKKYGTVLIEKSPQESTDFLKKLCTNFNSDSSDLSNGLLMKQDTKGDPEDYIHLFLKNSGMLVEFLEYLIREGGSILSCPVYNTLLEHYLCIWGKIDDSQERQRFSGKVVKFLQNPDMKYDKSQALVVCNMAGFSDGILYLYEEQKLYQQILRYHTSRRDSAQILACCRRFGHQEPNLWIQALWDCVVRDKNNSPPVDLLQEILAVVAREKLMSPQLVIDALGCNGNLEITLGHIRGYICGELERERKQSRELEDLTEKYREDSDKLRVQVENLRNGVIVIQGSRCAACHHPLELPTVHFLCQHSYHQHCFQSFSEDENECPACQPENKNLLELLKAREISKDLHENFHSHLEKAHDGFSVVAEYFGRGVFVNKYKIPKDLGIENNNPPSSSSSVPPARVSVEGTTTEGRMRQIEASSSTKGRVLIPKSEARVRVLENTKNFYSSSLDANFSPVTNTGREVPGNPFETEYDEAKNPFADEDEGLDSDENNPFREDYEGKSGVLNPFFAK